MAGIIALIGVDNFFYWFVEGHRRGMSAFEIGIVFPFAFLSVIAFRIGGVGIELMQVIGNYLRLSVMPPVAPLDEWGMMTAYWAHVGIIVSVLAIPAKHLPLVRYSVEDGGFEALSQPEKSEEFWGGNRGRSIRERFFDQPYSARRFRKNLPWVVGAIVMMGLAGYLWVFMVEHGYYSPEFKWVFSVVVLVMLILFLGIRIHLIKKHSRQ
ncbi:MAG: hypothetical protein HY039_06220 [Nitrospirae bacterium]|nr:hypothetical protein [Nitrospirota bacterium]